MKQPFLITVAALVVVCAGCFVLSFFTSPNRTSYLSSAQEADNTVITPKNGSVDCEFIIGGFEGKIAVFENGKTTPKKIFNVYLSTLPQYDKVQLEAGVPIANYEELVKRLEDYIS